MTTLSFIIPAYNESNRLDKTFQALSTLTLPKGLKLEEVIFVNDGSTDNTKFQISNFKFQIEKKKKMKVTFISYPYNRGKGFAVKKGMLASSADYSLFFDADMSTPLSEIKKFVPFINKKIDVIVGTRKNGKSTVLQHQSFIRENLGRGFTILTRLALGMDTTDFTCGFKAFSRQAKSTIFPACTIKRWGYDAEILFIAKKSGLSMVEKAVTWSNDPKTTVKLYKAIPQTLGDLALIHARHTIKPAIKSYASTMQFGIIYRGVQKITSVFL